MENTEWIILDTETTDFSALIFVADIAAPIKMGWEAAVHV
jgi:hypothetical protein